MIENLISKDMRANQERHHLLDTVDFLRLDATRKLATDRKANLGQFFTPASVAHLLASLFEYTPPVITLLDAGAGVGSLFAAYVANLCERDTRPEHIHVVAYEIDEILLEYLQETIYLCQKACEQVNIQFTG